MLSYKLEKFEGPLDLLLHLIEKNKVSIYDIQIFELSSEKNLKELPAESPSIFRISQ